MRIVNKYTGTEAEVIRIARRYVHIRIGAVDITMDKNSLATNWEPVTCRHCDLLKAVGQFDH